MRQAPPPRRNLQTQQAARVPEVLQDEAMATTVQGMNLTERIMPRLLRHTHLLRNPVLRQEWREHNDGDGEQGQRAEKISRPDDGQRTSSSLEEEAFMALSDGQKALDIEVLRKRCGFGDLVSEVYSPPRVVSMAESMGLEGDFLLT